MNQNRKRVPTLREVPRTNGRSNRRYFTFTEIKLNWPSSYVQSKWYFLSYGSEEIYLKQGWNIIGRRGSNHIQLMEPLLQKSCDLSIFIPADETPPIVNNVSGLCFYFGVRMRNTPYMLYHHCIITVVAENRSILFKFYDSSMQRLNGAHSNRRS